MLVSEDTSWPFECDNHMKKLLFFLYGQNYVNLVTWVILQLLNLNTLASHFWSPILLPSWKINAFFPFLNASFSLLLWQPLCKTPNSFLLFVWSDANSFGCFVMAAEIWPWTLSAHLCPIVPSCESPELGRPWLPGLPYLHIGSWCLFLLQNPSDITLSMQIIFISPDTAYVLYCLWTLLGTSQHFPSLSS